MIRLFLTHCGWRVSRQAVAGASRSSMIALALLLAPAATAQGPRMAIRGTETILAIDTAEITVRTRAGIAETEMLLTFRNPTNRPVEGEFSLPLPEGATISNYALEVDGALREAVAVEKERALIAYETIKAQRIDPGIVERQAGNVYRTRVFPVPARGTKQLRIGYVEVLPETVRGYHYRCPLAFDPAPARITLTLDTENHSTPVWRGDGDLTFTTRSGTHDIHTATLEDTAIKGTLEITAPAPDDARLVHAPGDAPYFLWCGRLPDLPESPRPAPKRILLFHDASESTIESDPAAALGLLDEWFATLGPLDVELRHLRDRASHGGVHRVAGGKWDSLRAAITTADPEGSASLLDLTDADADADLVLYLGRGQATAGPRIGKVENPLIVLHTGDRPPAAALAATATRTGGAVISVNHTERAAALGQLATEPFRIVSINGHSDIFHLIEGDLLESGRVVRLTGQWPDGPMPKLEITFARGEETRKTITPKSRHGEEDNLVRRLHAQRKLAALEAAPEPDVQAILDHCRTHNLASNTTSLIVLERFGDHIRFRIPPPEPELLARYQAEISRAPDPNEQLVRHWKSHAARHHRPYPGEEVLLFPRIRQVAIWKNAVSSVFEEHEIPAAPFAAIAGWHQRALALVERRPLLDSAEAHVEWRAEIDAAIDQGRELADVPADPPPDGKPIAVSVRGLVREPGVVRADPGLTMLQAIDRAGRVFINDWVDRIALYRNADKFLYNPESQEFEDIPLLPGDMLVLQDAPYRHLDGFSAPVDPASRPAVTRQPDSWVSLDHSGMDPFGGGRRQPNLPAIAIPEPAGLAAPPDLTEFAHLIAAGEDPATTWRKLKDGERFPAKVHIDAARILAKHGHHAEAATLLSTWVGRGGGIPPARLAEAFWLAEFGISETATARLAEPLPDHDPSPQLAFALANLSGDSASYNALNHAIDPEGNLGFNLIAINQLQNHPEAAGGTFYGGQVPVPEADIRIVIQSTDTARMPDISVVDPLGHAVNSFRPVSQTGGILTSAPGLVEFSIRRAIPGTYVLNARSTVEATLRITVHRDWARPEQQTTHKTHLLDGSSEWDSITMIDWEFRAE